MNFNLEIGVQFYYQKDLPTDAQVAPTEINGSERTNNFSQSTILRKGVIHKEVNDEKAFYSMDGISGHAGLFANKFNMIKALNFLATGISNNKRLISEEIIKKTQEVSKINDWQRTSFFSHGSGENKLRNFYGDTTKNCISHSGWTGIFSYYNLDNSNHLVILTNKKHSKFLSVNENKCEDDLKMKDIFKVIVERV